MRFLFSSLFIAFCAITLIAQTSKTMEFDGLTRKYLEYVPSSYDGSEAFPIVLCLHGLGDNMNNFYNIGMNYIADTENFIVLTPEAVADLNYGTAWNSGASYMGMVLNGNIDDVGFLNALLDSIILNYNVSENNIFVTGFSMGGFMTNRLATELNQKIKAVASVSGTIGNSFSGTPASAIPFCHFHGTADATVAFTNNNFGNDAEDLVDYWVGINNCNTTPDVDTLTDIANDGRRVVHFTYTGGDSNTEVEFYKVINGEHDWMYLPDFDISYTVKIWEFFNKYNNTEPSTLVNNLQVINECSLYPNPVENSFYISSEKFVDTYQIITVAGDVIYTEKIEKNSFEVYVNNLESGIYFVKLYTEKTFIIKKVIVN